MTSKYTPIADIVSNMPRFEDQNGHDSIRMPLQEKKRRDNFNHGHCHPQMGLTIQPLDRIPTAERSRSMDSRDWSTTSRARAALTAGMAASWSDKALQERQGRYYGASGSMSMSNSLTNARLSSSMQQTNLSKYRTKTPSTAGSRPMSMSRSMDRSIGHRYENSLQQSLSSNAYKDSLIQQLRSELQFLKVQPRQKGAQYPRQFINTVSDR